MRLPLGDPTEETCASHDSLVQEGSGPEPHWTLVRCSILPNLLEERRPGESPGPIVDQVGEVWVSGLIGDYF